MARWNAAADEDRFRDDVALGHRWVLWTARQLAAQDLDVVVPVPKIRSRFEDRRAFRDAGDLIVNGSTVEVRSVTARFWDPRTWPWRDVHVEPASVIQSKLAHSKLWLYVSIPERAIVGLFPNLRQLRLKQEVWNDRRRVHRDWMVADRRALITFESAVAYLHGQERTPCG